MASNSVSEKEACCLNRVDDHDAAYSWSYYHNHKAAQHSLHPTAFRAGPRCGLTTFANALGPCSRALAPPLGTYQSVQ